ncbi:two-component regulator propeller domain-containing protein [Spirosoma soli]|uniref:histidine kinase n=2 Tax=Spirosoma soli TaxID=1770529 RepID=A0ABW5M920_9BACT
MRIGLTGLIMTLWLWGSMGVQAQSYTASVKYYGPEQGLSHREVNAILQDKQGFMWFGTKFGLNRFDGLKFTTYTKERNGLDFDDIQSIAQDAEGYLWLMGANGPSQITLFNPLTGQAISFEDKFGKKRPPRAPDDHYRLLSSENGTIAFTDFQSARLVTYHPQSGLRYVAVPQFTKLIAFQVTNHHTVWAIADDQFVVELTLDGRIVHQFSHEVGSITICYGQRNAGIEFFYIARDPVKPASDITYSVDESGQPRVVPYSLLASSTRYIYPVCYAFDRSGLMWDGTSLRSATHGVVLTIAPQLTAEPIVNRSFFRDRNGLFWLGTSFGVYQVDLAENHFHRFFYQENTKDKRVAAVRGITVLDDQVFANLEKFGLYSAPRRGGVPKRQYPPNTATTNGDPFTLAYGLRQDGQGTLYGGIGHKLVRYQPATGRSRAAQFPELWDAWALHPLNAQHWLLGGRRGLYLFDTTQEKVTPYVKYNQFTELAQAQVLHIAPDRQGVIWICANTGLYTLHPQQGITARYGSEGKREYYLPAESFHHLYQDKAGIYWLATANAGLIRWDRRKGAYRQFRRSEGLSNDNIYAIYPDHRGHLWMSSDFGIMQFDPLRLTTQAYLVEDGITHNEFNRIAHFQEKNGRIYFGGLNGITAFDPQDFQTQKPTPELLVRITSFRQYDYSVGKVVDKTQDVITSHTITIQPDDRSSVLDFALLNYANAEKNLYAYRFNDLDEDWTYQSEPTLRLSNLPYGEHPLLIKAQAIDGQWSTNTLTIKLVVVRPFYLQSWFLVLMVLLVGAGIWAWLRWRIWQHRAEQLRLEAQVRQATARIEHDKTIIEQQAQDLLRLNQTRSHFFANISHEFRTPLTVILGMAAGLEAYKPDEKPQQLRQAADLIKRNGTNLLRLINQLLDLSKIEAGEMQLRPVRADLATFSRYIIESFQSMAKVKDIQLCVLGEEACEADFDKDKLQDILSNLLTNALKFTPEGGQIDYQLKRLDTWQPLGPEGYYEELTPTDYLDTPWIRFSVSDTGPGIEPSILPKVFDRFFQAGPSLDWPHQAGPIQAGPIQAGPIQAGPRQEDTLATSPVNGTGIGLSLVRELVLLMHGGLAVRNRSGLDRSGLDGSGLGAEFVVSLPLTRQAEPMQARPREAGPALEVSVAPALISSDRTEWSEPEILTSAANLPLLLLVEDNDDVAAYIQTCLRADYQVIRAENGQIGIELAFEKSPDVILSDVMMPVKDGFDLCDTLKTDERTSHIPIVLLTARAAVSDRLSGLRRGADAYLVKPFLPEELQVVLSNLIQTRRQLQSYYRQLALGGTPLGIASATLSPLQPGAPQPGEARPVDSLEDEFLIKLRTVIEAQLDNTELSVDTICLQVGMSRTTLHLKLTALTGMSVSRYVRALRLRRAQELLTATKQNVSEVAYAVGFEDPKYFSRVFSEEFGVSPGHYRQSAKG